MKKKITISVIIPIHNSETTLGDVLKSVEKQNYDVNQIILVDNNSKDSSHDLMLKHSKESRYDVKMIKHTEDRGLSYSYNEAILAAKTTHVITLQSDCVIMENEGVEKLIQPFSRDNKIVAACAYQTTPWNVWNTYNFWQKCLFSRFAGKILSGRNGRFCCFSMEALKKIGSFKQNIYRTAGEDGDLFFRLEAIGKIVDVDTVVEHIHNRSSKFSLKNYIYKENQLAEAVGACFSQNFLKVSLMKFKTAFIRPLFLIGLFIPEAGWIFIFLIFLSSLYFTKEVFIREWKDPRIVVLLFVNMFLFLSYTFYLGRGIITKRQTL